MWKTTYRHFSCSVLVETLGSVGLRLPLTQECCGLYSANTSRHSPVRSPVTPLFCCGTFAHIALSVCVCFSVDGSVAETCSLSTASGRPSPAGLELSLEAFPSGG